MSDKVTRKVRVLKRKRRLSRRSITMFAVLGVLILSASSISLFSRRAAAEDYTFGSEAVTKGYTATPTERNAADGSFESLIEADQYANANFSGTTETVTKGTASGAAFPGAFDTDDASRRAYTEVNTASNYQLVLRPISDSSVTLSPYPASPTTRYDKIDEATAGGNGDTDYVYPNNVANVDRYGMTQMTDPGAGSTINVRMWAWGDKTSTQSCNIQGGLYIGTTNYQAFSVNPANGVFNNYSLGWTTNPAGGAWAYTAVNALKTYLQTTDISPVWHVTQVGMVVWVNYTALYTADISVEYTGVVSDGQTVSYQVLCQGYRSGAENFYVYAWDYVAVGWSALKTTIAAASDTDYNFALTTNERDAVNNKVKLRILDQNPAEAVQDTVTLDVLKVNAIKAGYAVDVSMTAATVAQYGNVGLQVKGKCSNAENFYVALWNYTASAWDATVITITGAVNTLYAYDIRETWQRSTQEVKIRFTDSTAQTADQVADTCFLDWAVVTLTHTNPTLTKDGADPAIQESGSAISFFVTYTDLDNEAPTYVYAHIDSTDYSMAKNNSGDLAYWDGCAYSLSKSDLAQGSHAYYFKTKDANSPDVTTATKYVNVHAAPTITQYGVTPATGNNGQTFTFFATYNDVDGDVPTLMQLHIAGSTYAMTKNDSGDSTPPIAYYYQKAMSGGTHSYHFDCQDAYSAEVSTSPTNLVVNNGPSLSDYGLVPGDPRYPTTLLNATVTFTDVDNDPPSYVCFRFTSGGALNETMLAVDAGDTTYTDGKAYYVTWYQTHGAYGHEWACSDGKEHASGGAGTLTISNRDPSITNGPGSHVDQYRNAAWDYTFTATDPDGDSYVWALAGPAWLTVNPTTGYVSGTTANAPGLYSFTVYCNDSFGGTTNYAFDVHVSNRAPSITNGPGAHVDQWRNQAYYYVFTASDADTDTLVWQKSGPAWMAIGSSSGNFSGTTTDTPGTYGFTIWANDSYGGSANYAFDIHISNRAPDITNGPASHVDQYRNQAWYYAFTAIDADTDMLAWQKGGAAWLSIGSGTGNLSGSTTNTPGTYPFTVWANDSYGGSDSFGFEIHVSNRAPSISSTGNTSLWDGDFFCYHIIATDADADGLTYELSTDAAFLSIDGAWLNGTATPSGGYEYTIWVNDSYGGSDSEHEDLTVNEVVLPNNPPYFTSTPIYNVANNSAYGYDANATDDDLDPLTYDLSTDCSYLDINPGTGVVSGTPHRAGDFFVRISVTDGEVTAWQNYTLHVTSAAPSWSTSPVYSVANNSAYSYAAHANDPEGETLYYALTGSATSFLTINHVTGAISGAPHHSGTYAANLTCTDYTNTIYQNWSLAVTSTAPWFTSSPVTTKANHTAYSYDANAADTEGETLLFILGGNATFFSINSSSGLITGTMGPLGWYYANISVTDYTFTVWQNFTLWSTNTAPYFTGTPVETADLNISYHYLTNVVDPNGDTLWYAVAEGPAWLFIDNLTGEVGGTPNEYGVWSVELTAFDGHAYCWQNYTLTCAEPYVPPIPPTPPPSLLAAGFTLALGLIGAAIVLRFLGRAGRGDEPRPQREDRR